MWSYQTLAYAVKSGTRYSIVHGKDCSAGQNTCTVTISQIAGVIESAGVGLPANSVTLTFTDANGTATTCVVSDCLANYTSSAWPPSTANAPGQDVRISGLVPFQSSMAMFWPGAGRPMGVPGVWLSADSRETIQF
jgi:hypothetical protein